MGYITTKKTDDYENIHSVNSLYLMLDKADWSYLRKIIKKDIYFLIEQIETKKYLKSTQNFGMRLKMKLIP